MNRTVVILPLGLAMLLTATFAQAQQREWKITANGQLVPGPWKLNVDPSKTVKSVSMTHLPTKKPYPVPYEAFADEDLNFLAEKYSAGALDHCLQAIGPRIQKHFQNHGGFTPGLIKDLSDQKKRTPFAAKVIEDQLSAAIEGQKRQLGNDAILAIVEGFPELKEVLKKAIIQSVKDPLVKWTYEELKTLNAQFPDLQPPVIPGRVKFHLDRPTPDFWGPLAAGLVPSQMPSVANKLAALKVVLADFTSLYDDVAVIVAKELRNPQFWDQVRNVDVDTVISLKQSFLDVRKDEEQNKELQTELENAVLRVLDDALAIQKRNQPATNEENFLDPNRPDQIEHEKLKRIIAAFPDMQKKVEETIVNELRRPSNRWSRRELNRLWTDYGGDQQGELRPIQKAIQDAVVVGLNNPVFRWGFKELVELQRSYKLDEQHITRVIIGELELEERKRTIDELKEMANVVPGLADKIEEVIAGRLPELEYPALVGIARSFPNLSPKVAAVALEKIKGDRNITYDQMVDLVKVLDGLRKPVEELLRSRLADPLFRRDFTDLEKVNKILVDFPGLDDAVAPLVNDLITGRGQEGWFFDRAATETISTRFPKLREAAQTVIRKAFAETGRQWVLSELEFLLARFPDLKADMEPIYVRQLKNPEFAKQVSATLEKLNDVITNFPKTEADVTRLLEQHIKSHYGVYYVQHGWRFNHYVLSEIASKYTNLRGPAISVIRGAADAKHQWPREELYFVFTTFPEIEDKFIEIMRNEIQIQDFPQNELEELGTRFGSLRPDVVKKLVDYVNDPRRPYDITSLVGLVQKFPEVQAAAEARAKPIIQQGIQYSTIDQIELNFGRYVEFKKLVCGIVLENPKEIIQRSQGPQIQTWVDAPRILCD